MKRKLSLTFLVISLAFVSCLALVSQGERFDPSIVNPETLREIIEEQQRKNVRESYGIWAHQCFTDDDLNQFISSGQAARIALSLKGSKQFMAVVSALKKLPAKQRQKLLGSCRRPLRKTWAQLGRISSEGQTEAGQQAEKLIADAIVDLVEELIKAMPGSKSP
ncbi:MAG: hypothetical protein ABIN58_02900 [candidate division WOR-3 bacterium]